MIPNWAMAADRCNMEAKKHISNARGKFAYVIYRINTTASSCHCNNQQQHHKQVFDGGIRDQDPATLMLKVDGSGKQGCRRQTSAPPPTGLTTSGS